MNIEPRLNPDAGLSKADLKMLLERLVEKRVELARQLEALEAQVVIKDDCGIADAAEAASRQENRQRAIGILEQQRHTIREIDAAVVRMTRGEYGISETSGEPIGHERLRLVPWARSEA